MLSQANSHPRAPCLSYSSHRPGGLFKAKPPLFLLPRGEQQVGGAGETPGALSSALARSALARVLERGQLGFHGNAFETLQQPIVWVSGA